MNYTTIVLELMEQNPQILDEMKRTRQLPPTLERFALELKANHERWKGIFAQAKPESSETQIASEAMEMVVEELERRLTADLLPPENDNLSLDEAMAFIRHHTPPA